MAPKKRRTADEEAPADCRRPAASTPTRPRKTEQSTATSEDALEAANSSSSAAAAAPPISQSRNAVVQAPKMRRAGDAGPFVEEQSAEAPQRQGGRPRGGNSESVKRRQAREAGLPDGRGDGSSERTQRQRAREAGLPDGRGDGSSVWTQRRQRASEGLARPVGAPLQGWHLHWARRGLSMVCYVCDTMTPAAHIIARMRSTERCPRGTLVDVCRRCDDSGARESLRIAKPPRALLNLRYAERTLLARAQFNQMLVDLPKGGVVGQFGRLYIVPLPVPQAVDLFEKAEMIDAEGHLHIVWPGQSGENALPLRAQHLLDALTWLHEHNPHYADDRVNAVLIKWRGRLQQHRGGYFNAIRASEEGDEDKRARKCQDDVTLLTSGGPPPRTATAVEMEQLRGLARLEKRIDEKLFPMLFPNGQGYLDEITSPE